MTRARNTADTQTASGGPVSPGIAGKNAVINGGMDIWQRGTSFTVANSVYLMDRWYNTGDTNLTVTRDTDVPTNPYFNYSAKLVGTGTQSITQKIESANSARLAGQVVTISLYAKKTSGTGALNINIYYPSATDNFASITQIGSALQMSSNPGSSWTRYSVTTSALPADVQKGFVVLIDNVNTHTIFITGVQVELGSVATPFSRAGGTYQGELAACQRYFYRTTFNKYQSWARDTNLIFFNFRNPTTMRGNPSVSTSITSKVAGSPANSTQIGFYYGSSIAGTGTLTLGTDSATTDAVTIYFSGASFTQGVIPTAEVSGGYFDVSAEL